MNFCRWQNYSHNSLLPRNKNISILAANQQKSKDDEERSSLALVQRRAASSVSGHTQLLRVVKPSVPCLLATSTPPYQAYLTYLAYLPLGNLYYTIGGSTPPYQASKSKHLKGRIGSLSVKVSGAFWLITGVKIVQCHVLLESKVWSLKKLTKLPKATQITWNIW